MVITGKKRSSDMVDLEQVLNFSSEKPLHHLASVLVIGKVHVTRTRLMDSDGEKHLNGCLFPRELEDAMPFPQYNMPSTSSCSCSHYCISMVLDKADGGRDVVENRSYIWKSKESQC